MNARSNKRRIGTLSAGILLAALMWPAAAAPAVEGMPSSDRFDGLVASLNADSAGRSRTVELIYSELRGPDSRLMRQTLQDALGGSNSLILQGIVEVMAMLGDDDALASVEALLATTTFFEVKTLILRLLPAYCLRGSERARFNYIRHAAGDGRVSDPAVLIPLRRPPLSRRGRFEPEQDRRQTRIVRMIAEQFNPAGAALRRIDDPSRASAARAAVRHYVGDSLGNDPARWARLWAEQGGEGNYLPVDEVLEIRLAALQSLSDMGAEGLPEALEGIDRLLDAEDEVLRQAVFETLAVMCRAGYGIFASLAAANSPDRESPESENWRKRRSAAAAGLAVFAVDRSSKLLAGAGVPADFAAAADCLSAALAWPGGFPDPDKSLETARERGLATLERLLMMPDLPFAKRAAAATALGGIGTPRAVADMRSILDSPYASPESGADGMRMVETVVDALRAISSGDGGGGNAARELMLELLGDPREFASPRPDVPPIRLGHIVLWRMQRMAKSDSSSLEPEYWRERLGWR